MALNYISVTLEDFAQTLVSCKTINNKLKDALPSILLITCDTIFETFRNSYEKLKTNANYRTKTC